MYQKFQKNNKRTTIYINCSKSISSAASMQGNSLRHSISKSATKDSKLGSLRITSELSLFFG